MIKNKDLIFKLAKHDPDMPIMIQQGEPDFDYMAVYTVRKKEVEIDGEVKKCIVIEYT